MNKMSLENFVCFLALAETLFQILILMDDWHKSLLDWCKFDSTYEAIEV